MGLRYSLHRRLIYFLADRLGMTDCYRCGGHINQELFSIEHTKGWETEADFLNVEEIAFSHIKCNQAAGGKETGMVMRAKAECKYGHPYNESNTYWYKARNGMARQCRKCRVSRVTAFKKARSS